MKSSILQAVLATMLMSGVASADPIVFSGDMLFRHEMIKDELTPGGFNAERVRERLRLRLKGDVKINDATSATFRIATGSTAATATTTRFNDMGNFNSGNGIVLDMAYFKYTASEIFSVTAGKMMNPFYQVNDVVFDSDIAPEGVALKYAQKFDTTEVWAALGNSWLAERTGSTGTPGSMDDTMLVGAQVGANYKADAFNVLLVASNYNFANMKGYAAPATTQGNTYTGANFAFDYKLTSIGLEVGTKLADIPFVFFGDSITNGAEGVSNNKTATTFGVKINKLKEKGSWTASVDTREVQKDSLPGVFTDGDSSGGGANISSLRVRFGYQLGDNASMYLNYLDGKKAINTVDTATGVAVTDISTKANRMQLDFAMNF